MYDDEGRFGVRPDVASPLANKADAAWERLQELREYARKLGIEVREAWPVDRLKEEITAHLDKSGGSTS